MAKILILFAHPVLEKSRVQAKLIKAARNIEGVTFHDLYEAYPDFDIDVEAEKELLLQHDIIIWQHPFYWYSCPAIIKQWLDLVLEHNWAYGTTGTRLQNKLACNVITTGGIAEAYHEAGRNRFTIAQLLAPFDQTAHLCKMHYLPPFVVHGTHKIGNEEIDTYAHQYRDLLIKLRDEQISPAKCEKIFYLNELNSIL